MQVCGTTNDYQSKSTKDSQPPGSESHLERRRGNW